MPRTYASCPVDFKPVHDQRTGLRIFLNGSKFMNEKFKSVSNVSCKGCDLLLDQASFLAAWRAKGSPTYEA